MMRRDAEYPLSRRIARACLSAAIAAGPFACPLSLFAQPSPPPDAAVDEDLGKDSSTEINVKNADLAAIVRIFSRKTKRNYILDENLKGKVSIYLPGKVSSDEAIKILDAVLALKGFTSVPIGENLWKIIASREAKQSTIPTLVDDREGSPSAAMVTRLAPLKYVDVEDVQKLVSPLVSANGLISAYTGTNSLMIIDSEDNIERIVRIIESIDVPFSDREMTIIPVKNADANDIAEKLNQILGTGSAQAEGGAPDLLRAPGRQGLQRTSAQIGSVPAPGAPGGQAAPQSAASSTVAARAREPKIIADERTNSLIVVADDDTTARVRALVSQLDSKLDLSGSKFYVYRCQHAKADELAQVLSGLVGGGGGAGQQTPFALRDDATSNSIGNTGSRSRGDRFNRTQDRLQDQQRTPGRSRLEDRGGANGVSSVSLGENISITADPATNSLIIAAGKTDYEKIKALLEKLDIKRRQVLVEAMLLEVGVDDSTTLGTEFLASTGGADGGALVKSDFGNLATLLSNPTQLSSFSVAAASSGTLTLPGDITIPTQTVLLSAAQRNSNVNVLSAPTILTTDNEEAEIVVGQNIPFVASRSTSETNLANTFNQIDRQDVGITLRLTPQISSEDYVNLRIFTEVSDVIAATLTSDLGPTTTIRTSETTVITKDSQMIVIGGLMSDDSSESDNGVPFLKDIPVFGQIFRATSQARRRTNLLIFITPRIVTDQFDARDTTIDRRDRIESDIKARDVYPDRREILRNENLDRVAEAKQYSGEKPGTIKGKDDVGSDLRAKLGEVKRETRVVRGGQDIVPDGGEAGGSAGENRAEPSPIVEKDLAAGTGTGGDDVIELRVSPELPEVASPGLLPSRAARDSRPRHGRYVVFDLGKKRELPKGAPFRIDDKNGRIGVYIPAESSAGAKTFFEVGKRYAYNLGSSELNLVPIGVFNSESEANAFYSGLEGSWYTLSPYEIINIGKFPWTQSR